jgi:hypothetical protein
MSCSAQTDRNVDEKERAMKIGSMFALTCCIIAAAPTAAKADDRQGENACVNDAMTVCSQYIPDRSRVAGCLINNRTRISPSCRAQLAHWHD